jgi:EAL domain-containing protein (putative c-di-GMP-specific phosphodiesterase class I)
VDESIFRRYTAMISSMTAGERARPELIEMSRRRRIACLKALAWRVIGLTPVRVAVNISACQFVQKQFASEVADILQDTGLDPALLELELTESMLINNTENIITVMQELKDIGVGLSLDDFGTGYSSLSHLARLPIDSLKIDQSFIAAIGKLPTNGSICTIIMALAGSLGLRTIAEGVETQQQLKFMIAHNCDEMQGYFFSRPLPADQCTRLLTTVNTQRENEIPINSRFVQRIGG